MSSVYALGARIDRLVGDAPRPWRLTIRQLAASVLALAVAVTMLLSALPLIREGGGKGPTPVGEVISVKTAR